MTKREIASLACKLLSLFTIINALGQVMNSLSLILMPFIMSPSTKSQTSNWVLLLVFVVPLMLQIAFAMVLWILSDGIAIAMVKREEIMPTSINLRSVDVQTIAFSFVGLMAVVQSLPRICSFIAQYVISQQSGTTLGLQFTLRVTELVVGIVQLLIGLGVLLEASVLVRWLNHRSGAEDNNLIPSQPHTDPSDSTI